MTLRAVLLSLFVATSCGPSRNVGAYSPVRVAIGQGLDGTDWRADQRQEIRTELASMALLGPDWTAVSEGTPIAPDVTARTFDSTGSGARCHLGAGRFTAGTNFVEVDPACADGNPALRRAIAHELMHWWTSKLGWFGHVCQRAGDAPDCHPTIHGDALLNPALGYLDSGPAFDAVWTPSNPDASPTQSDLDLFSRCFSRGNCL